MATNSNWTVVFEDKLIINQDVKIDGHSVGYNIDDDSFWNDSKWSNIWAIQYKDDNLDYNDTIEFRDDTPHTTWTEAGLGDFHAQFVTKWENAHLARLQSDWDNDNELVEEPKGSESYRDETSAEKIARLGARPTSSS
jgi:hypothetical protein